MILDKDVLAGKDKQRARRLNKKILKGLGFGLVLLIVGVFIALNLDSDNPNISVDQEQATIEQLSPEELKAQTETYYHMYLMLSHQLLDMINNEAFLQYGFSAKGRTAHLKWKEQVEHLRDNTPRPVMLATYDHSCNHALLPSDLLVIATDAIQNRGNLSPSARTTLTAIACATKNHGK